MKRVLIIIFFTFLYLTIYSQVTKLNQGSPLHHNNGRIIKLKKVATIGGRRSKFLFSDPTRLRTAKDGSLYIMEFNRLLKFNPKGKFIKNLCKLGQGPGEVGFLKGFLPLGESVLLFGKMPKKIIEFDSRGNIKKEFIVRRPMLGADLLLYRENKYYFLYSAAMPVKSEPRYVDVEHYIAELSTDGKVLKNLTSFAVKLYVMALGNDGWRACNIGEFKSGIYMDRYLVFTHTPDYLIKIYDVAENKITHVFSRKYNRVNFRGEKWGGKKYAPKVEFENDIKNIFILDHTVWVVTSTTDHEGYAQVDTFDLDGTYTDSFYLTTKGEVLGLGDGHVFVKETGDDFNTYIVKYRLPGR